MANIFSICSTNVFNQPNAARFPVHQIRPLTQDNIGLATPTQASTSSASAPLQNVGQVASGECTTTVHQDLPRAPEQIRVVAPQDNQSSVTTLAPIPIDTPALAAPAIGNTAQIASGEHTNIIPQGLPSAAESLAAPQDGQSSVTTLAPTGIPIDTPALAAPAIGNGDKSATTYAPAVTVPPAGNTSERRRAPVLQCPTPRNR